MSYDKVKPVDGLFYGFVYAIASARRDFLYHNVIYGEPDQDRDPDYP